MNKPVQTIELTSKKWKGWQLIGTGIIILGFVFIIPSFVLGFSVLTIGAIIGFYASIMAWWHHG